MPKQPKRPTRKRRKQASSPRAKKEANSRAKITARKCLGTPDLDAVARLRRQFEADARRWIEGLRTKDNLIAAFGYWIGYPMFLKLIGHKWRADTERTAAYHALNFTHRQATTVLMEEAEKHGLDPHPLYECTRVVQEIYADEPERFYIGPYDTWPECMGRSRYTLPAGQQDALRAGEAVFIRLAVRIGVAQDEDMAEVAAKAKPSLPSAEERCVPMSLAEIARRYMDDQDARSDKVKPLLEERGLRREVKGKNKWTIRLDGLDAKTRKRLTRPTYP